jgi:DNA invertase Pin-like site-specific DNA recombinase
LAALKDYVRAGDTVMVWKLDRLGRNMIHILQTVDDAASPQAQWR